MAAATGASTAVSKLRRSALNCPATQTPRVRSTASSGLENVENSSATAVTSVSCTRVRPIGTSSRRSRAGARHPCCTHSMVDQFLVEQHRVERGGHQREIHRQGEDQPGELAEQERGAAQRLGEDGVDAPPFHFLGHQAGADEERDEQADHVHRRQAEVLDHLQVLGGGETAHQERRGHQHHGEQHQAVRHAVAHRLLEHGEGDGAHGGKVHSEAVSRARARRHVLDEERLQGVAYRIEREHLRPGGGQLAQHRIGRIGRQFHGVAAAVERHQWTGPGPQRRQRRLGDAVHDQLPALGLEREQLGQPAAGDQPALGDDADLAAQRLGIRQDVRAEEHRAAAIAQAEHQLADVAAAERIEPRHRLVEEHDLGAVEDRLGDPDPLHHALGVGAQAQAPLLADPDLRRAPRRCAPGGRGPACRTGGRSSRAAPRR